MTGVIDLQQAARPTYTKLLIMRTSLAVDVGAPSWFFYWLAAKTTCYTSTSDVVASILVSGIDFFSDPNEKHELAQWWHF
jgi:hypothetical protein